MQISKRNNHGFSLSETLVTVLLLGIVLSAVTTGVHAMVDSYYSIRRRADAESLLMTASDVISGDLRNVTSVVEDSSGDSYFCEGRYSYIQYENDDENGIKVRYLSYQDDAGIDDKLTVTKNEKDGSPIKKPLVTDKTNADQLYTKLVIPKDSTDQVNLIQSNPAKDRFEYTLEVFSKSDDTKALATQTITVKPLNKVDVISSDGSTQG